MPHPFRAFELIVLRAVLAEEFTPAQFGQILEEAVANDVTYTGWGFYISMRHPLIGEARRLYSAPPALSAHSTEGRIAGFMMILENQQLTLEIYPWDPPEDGLPAEFRDSDVQIRPHKSAQAI